MDAIPITVTEKVIDEGERKAQLAYWQHHVAIDASVRTMMLDSQAQAIDELERPEILGTRVLMLLILARNVCCGCICRIYSKRFLSVVCSTLVQLSLFQ